MKSTKDTSKPIYPGTILRLVKLWPHARKQGKESGDIWRVGYYSRQDGLDIIWLVDKEGHYNWTVGRDFLLRHFEIQSIPQSKSLYGPRKSKRLTGGIKTKPGR